MLAKTITYEDYNGNKKTKNFYFHLTKTELAKMQIMENGGLKEKIKKMVESDDNRAIYNYFEDFVLSCYGEKMADGEGFLKSPEIRQRFQCHPAYDKLMMEFIEGGDKAMADFINAVVPKELQDSIANADPDELNKLVGYEVIPGGKQN